MYAQSPDERDEGNPGMKQEMPANKDHWYDGWLYDTWIAPNQDHLFEQVKRLIKPGSTVIDVGCGTGRLAFMLAETCTTVMGIDLSVRNIRRADRTLSRNPHPGILFEHKSAADILSERGKHYDYAVMTYVLHEVPEHLRAGLLRDVFGIADTIILGDYLVPRPEGFRSYLNHVVEFFAGRDHYRNFKTFVTLGGLPGLAKTLPLRTLHEVRDTPETAHIVVLTALREES